MGRVLLRRATASHEQLNHGQRCVAVDNPANGVPFLFSDGTTIGMNPSQRVTFLGATYIYRLP